MQFQKKVGKDKNWNENNLKDWLNQKEMPDWWRDRTVVQ